MTAVVLIIVFLGDSITDGHTYPALLRQALIEAHAEQIPTTINAGIGGDTAQGMLARLERDVLVHRPTIVTLSAGINDSLRGVTIEDYRTQMTAIVDQLSKHHIQVVLMTTSTLGPKHPQGSERLAQYNQFLRELALSRKLPLAEVNGLMTQAQAQGVTVLEDDQIHPNFAGQRIMARALLDALGHHDMAVPEQLTPTLLPGVVTPWQFQAVPDKAPALDETTAAALQPDRTWKTITVPIDAPGDTWWLDHERLRGFVLNLDRLVAPGKLFRGITTVQNHTNQPINLRLNTGAHLQTVFLNGKLVYRSQGWTGWHAGKERIPVTLQPGDNRLVIETGATFFLSLTELNTEW